MCPTDLERVDSTAALASRLRADEGTHRDSHEKSHPRSCSKDDEFVESEDGELYRLEIRNGKKVHVT